MRRPSPAGAARRRSSRRRGCGAPSPSPATCHRTWRPRESATRSAATIRHPADGRRAARLPGRGRPAWRARRPPSRRAHSQTGCGRAADPPSRRAARWSPSVRAWRATPACRRSRRPRHDRALTPQRGHAPHRRCCGTSSTDARDASAGLRWRDTPRRALPRRARRAATVQE